MLIIWDGKIINLKNIIYIELRSDSLCFCSTLDQDGDEWFFGTSDLASYNFERIFESYDSNLRICFLFNEMP